MFHYIIFNALVLVFYFFFFQAEDGIRDYKVTGVQTCALPISVMSLAITDRERAEELLRRSEARFARLSESGIIGIVVADLRGGPFEANDAFRSEERRVGKECRSRWSPYH